MKRSYFYLMCLVVLFSALPVLAQLRTLDDPAVTRFLKHGNFDPAQISEDELLASLQDAYQRSVPSQAGNIAERLLRLKWWRLWQANAEMPSESELVTDPLPHYFHSTENWHWSDPVGSGQTRWHYGDLAHGSARHKAKGVFPALLPVNGTLLQEVILPDEHLPDQIWLRIKTKYVGNMHAEPSKIVQARWTKKPESHLATENRPDNFWAGKFTTSRGKKQTLVVNLVDLGLCGRERAILGIEFVALGGQAWFGRTLIRRPSVEIRGTAPYHIFAEGEELRFDLDVHNFFSVEADYTLTLNVSDYDGSQLLNSTYHLSIPAHDSRRKTLTLQADGKRYVTFTYTLTRAGEHVEHGYSAAAVIAPQAGGRNPHSKFGMMYWDHPGEWMSRLFERLGVKLLVIFPELERLHLFDAQTFELMPMFWALPQRAPEEAKKLPHQIQPYLKAGHTTFSNFWETDLRVPAAMFARNMQKFSRIIKQAQPAAFVGIGGMAWFNVAYLHELLEAAKDGPAFFDFVALMLYNTPSPPEFSGMSHETDALQTVLNQAGKPQTELWNVEWSYFEGLNLDGKLWLNTCVPRKDIAAYTIRHHLLGFAAGIDRMIPGSIVYAGRMPLAKNYGHSMTLGGPSIIRYDQTPLPLLPAYSTMTRLLEDKAFVRDASRKPDVKCQVYQTSDAQPGSAESVIALWSVFGKEPVTLAFNTKQDGNVMLLNMIGEPTQFTTFHGELCLSISPEPTYIIVPQRLNANLAALEVLTDEPLLSITPSALELVPGKTAQAALTCNVRNFTDRPLQGAVRLRPPNGWNLLETDVTYPDAVGERLASEVLDHIDSEESTQAFWLGRHRDVNISYVVGLPEKFTGMPYYEQTALTGLAEFPLAAELLFKQRPIARVNTTLRIRPPLRVRMRPLLRDSEARNAPLIRVTLTNSSAIPRQGAVESKIPRNLRVTPRQAVFKLAPAQTASYDFALRLTAEEPLKYAFEHVDWHLRRTTQPVELQAGQTAPFDHYRPELGYLRSFGVGEGYPVEALVRENTGYETRQLRGFAFYPAAKAHTPIRIDGNLDDWQRALPRFIDPQGKLNGLTFFAKDYGAEMQWRGRDDFSPAWQIMWDAQALYLACKVFDDQIVPQHELGTFWNGDGISLQIDPQPDATDASILPEQRDLRSVHTFEIGLSPNGPVMRRKYASLRHLPGAVANARLAIVAEKDGLVYELALPWTELAPLAPTSGAWFGLSLIFNEDDGHGRETQVNWFGGSGGDGLAREPRLMGDVHLVE